MNNIALWVKVIFVIAAVAVLSFIVVALIAKPSQPETDTQPVAEEELGLVKNIEVAPEKLPERMPENLPLEEDATVLQNYNSEDQDGQFQATRQYITKLSLNQNLNTYTKYLNSTGWEIKSTVNEDKYKMLLAKKGIKQLIIIMNENSVNGQATVNITYSEI